MIDQARTSDSVHARVQNQPLSRRRFLTQAGTVSLAAMLASGASASVLSELVGSGQIKKDQLLGWEQLRKHTWGLSSLPYGGNTLIVATPEGAMLVDTSFPALASSILQDANTLSEDAPLTLVNTHHHSDHTAGNAYVLPGTVASYAHANAFPRIKASLPQARQMARSAPNQVNSMGITNKDVLGLAIKAADHQDTMTEADMTPKTSVNDHAQLDIGGLRVDLHHFGNGHTDNDLVVHIPERNIIHTGDLLFNGLHPFFDANAGVNPEGWIDALDNIAALCNADTVVVPGHGPFTNRSAIRTQIAYHEGLLKGVQDAIDEGKSRDEAREMSWDFMEGLGFEQLRQRAIGAVYDILKG